MALEIAAVEIFHLDPPAPTEAGTAATGQGWNRTFRQASPFDRFDQAVGRREPGGLIWVKVIATDGTYGLGNTDTGDVAGGIESTAGDDETSPTSNNGGGE